jgi:hypothetical protein
MRRNSDTDLRRAQRAVVEDPSHANAIRLARAYERAGLGLVTTTLAVSGHEGFEATRLVVFAHDRRIRTADVIGLAREAVADQVRNGDEKFQEWFRSNGHIGWAEALNMVPPEVWARHGLELVAVTAAHAELDNDEILAESSSDVDRVVATVSWAPDASGMHERELATFNVAPWLAQLDDEEIERLHHDEWTGHFPADLIVDAVEFMEERDPNLRAALTPYPARDRSHELLCRIEDDQAKDWVWRRRPRLARSLFRDEDYR